ncbi:MAG TPA: alpha/beta hydrolase [Steroidobacteraceae bacterium]|nr:alpha/beta hydrolase [Steroidobacteraceae bacterium]
MTETPFYFSRGDTRLFGMLHAPQPAAPAHTAYVMSHPFGEEKLWSHRVFVVFARTLAARGIPVLRFDYSGAGDSGGDTASASVDAYLDDLGAAVDALAARVPSATRVGLVGLRFGATLAAQFAERARLTQKYPAVQVGPLALWDPILDGESYIQELLRINLSTQLAVYGKVQESREVLVERIRGGGIANVEGYEIGLPLFASASLKELLPADGLRHAGGTLVVQIAATEKAKLREDQQRLAELSTEGTFQRAIEQPFWREIKAFCSRAENLQNQTLQWMEQRHGLPAT